VAARAGALDRVARLDAGEPAARRTVAMLDEIDRQRARLRIVLADRVVPPRDLARRRPAIRSPDPGRASTPARRDRSPRSGRASCAA